VLQRAMVRLLEPIYEEAFHDFSYGFRPKRSPHQALDAFWRQATGLGVRWVLEVDIRKYFDSVNRTRLLELVGARIGDWCRLHRHRGMFDQFRMLVQKLEGHYAYYGITGNGRGLNQVRTETQKLWYKWLRRPSREPGGMTWDWMNRMLKETFVFPHARVVHSIYRAKP
jgi:hypothetical protein